MTAMTDALPDLVDSHLVASDRVQRERFPDPDIGWQPVHTVYVPADQFDATTLTSWSSTAAELFDRMVGGDDDMIELFGVDPFDAAVVRQRVLAKFGTANRPDAPEPR